MEKKSRRTIESKWFQTCKKIMNVLTGMILGIVIVLGLLKGLGYEPYRILTGSMEPTLVVGEVVIINTNDREAKEGDVIAFQMGEHVVIHRVKKLVSEGGYITKGDSNAAEDFQPVSQKEVIGTLWMRLGVFTGFWNLFASKGSKVFLFGLMLLNILTEVHVESGEREDVGYA